MSKHKQYGVERQRLVTDADILSTRAEAAQALAGSSRTFDIKYRNVAKMFEEAALLYRQAGLGLAARAAYQDASEAFTTAGRLQDASKCQGLAEAVPVYYEEEI